VPGAEIGIGSRWAGQGVELWVRDTGTGIDPEEQERIFDRFARGRSGRRSEGAGLGLAIVRTIAEAHGGSVEVESALGEGSRFGIFLPGRAAVGPPTDRLSVPGQPDDTSRVDTWAGTR
jgi:signal transduction histidine kinase